MSDWQPIETMPEEIPLLTKIDDEKGERNVQVMVRRGSLWYIGAGKPNEMYVYYRPTHWRTPPSEGAKR